MYPGQNKFKRFKIYSSKKINIPPNIRKDITKLVSKNTMLKQLWLLRLLFMNSKNRKIFNNLIDKNKISKKIVYGLSPNSLFNDDIIEGIKVLLSKKITMGNITKKFEEEFSKYIGTKYALMVNSGSSANLLALFGLINPLKKNSLNSVMKF